MADLDFITVIGRFGLTVGDGGDLDEDPDIIWCDEGKVTLQPINSFTKVTGGSPIGWTGGNAVIEAPLDASGYMTRSGVRRVRVVDMTSSKVNPVVPAGNATHTVRFVGVKAAGTAVNFDVVNVRIAPDTVRTVTDPAEASTLGLAIGDQVADLVDLMPVPAAGGTPIVVGPRGYGIAALSVVGNALVATMEDASTLSTDLPVAMVNNAAFVSSQMATPEQFGAVGDGVANDTAALAAWIGSGATGLALRPGRTYLTTAPLIHPATLKVVEGNGATIKATSTVAAFIWEKTSTAGLIGLRISNLTLDCNAKMDGMKLRAVSRGDINGLRVLNSTGHGLALGDASGAKSNGMRVNEFKAQYDTQPVGSIGLGLYKANDTHIVMPEVYGAATGILTDASSFNSVIMAPHVWGLNSAGNRPGTCYDLSASATMFRPFADTPTTYGFRLRTGGPYNLNSPQVYNNPAEGNDNTIVGIHLDDYLTVNVSNATFIGGDATHRLAADIEGPLQFVTSMSSYYFQTVTQRLVPTPRRREWQPENSGLKAWAFDPISIEEFARPTAGQLQMVRVPWQPGELATSVLLNFQAGGTGLTAGQCFAAVFDAAGNWLASSTDRSANWASSGVKTCNLTAPIRCNDPYLWVGFFWNGTTGPQVYRGSSNDGPNANLTTPRFATGQSGLTTAMPATATPAASTASWWAAVI